jgi:hypothetical protein
MIWLPLLSFLYSLFIAKVNLKFIFPGILVLFLFFIKNIYTFGFPVFPVQILDIGVSWKPNPELLKISSEMAILKTFDLQYTIEEIRNFSTLESIKNWLLLKGIKGKIHIFLILVLLIFLVFSMRKKSKLIWIIFVSIIVKSVLVLSFSAQYRFFIDVFFVVFFVIFYNTFFRKLAMSIFIGSSFLAAGLLSFPNLLKTHLPSFRIAGFMNGFHGNQFYKPSEYEWKNYETYQIGNLKFNVVKNYPFSFDTPIPAISPEFLQEYYDVGIFPQKNSKNLKDGFHWRKMTDEEKQELKDILTSGL